MTTTPDTTSNPVRQLAQVRAKLANLVGNATCRLNTDDAHPGHVLDQVLDRLTEIAEDTTTGAIHVGPFHTSPPEVYP